MAKSENQVIAWGESSQSMEDEHPKLAKIATVILEKKSCCFQIEASKEIDG